MEKSQLIQTYPVHLAYPTLANTSTPEVPPLEIAIEELASLPMYAACWLMVEL